MILGISGKTASGKSEVMKILKKMKFCCIDADKITHEVYKKGEKGAKIIANHFGKHFLDKNGEVNRVKLRNFILSDPKKIKTLNRLIHPIIHKEIEKLIKKSKNKNIAIEAVYFDVNGLLKSVDNVIWVERNEKKIKLVLQKERKLSKLESEIIFDLIEKPKKVDFVLKNNGNLSILEKQLKAYLS
jgi:dephospho-CoA kinase